MKAPYRIGPGAASILMVIVVVSMAILGLLALSEAQNEARLSEKNAAFVKEKAQTEAEAEKTLMQLDEILVSARKNTDNNDEYFEYINSVLPDGMTMEDNLISWTEGGQSAKSLLVTLRILPMESPVRFEWIRRQMISNAA